MYRASLQQKKIAAATSETETVSVWKRLEPRVSYGTRETNVLVTQDENVERGNREIELFSPRAPVPSVFGQVPPLGTTENICNQPRLIQTTSGPGTGRGLARLMMKQASLSKPLRLQPGEGCSASSEYEDWRQTVYAEEHLSSGSESASDTESVESGFGAARKRPEQLHGHNVVQPVYQLLDDEI